MKYADVKSEWGGVDAPREFFGNASAGWTEVPNCDKPTQELLTHSYSQMLRRELTKIRYDLPENVAAKNVINGFHVPYGKRLPTCVFF